MFVGGDGSTLPPSPNCFSPLYDLSDKTALTWVRSDDRQGDYVVEIGKYAVAKGEPLRLECGTGKPLGIVIR